MAFTSVSRPHKIRRASFLIILTFFLIHPLPAFAQVATTITPESEAALDEELRWLKAETYVITPSRIPEKIKKTASSITVITDRQIRQMGARDLTDVLARAVPGVFSFLHTKSGTRAINVRGAGEWPATLLMINSHPLNNIFWGTWANHHDLIIDNIERIEVIRGPGSAVYGANAFHGVINVITKEAEDIDGLELSALGGSWDTQQYNLLYGKTFNELEVAFDFNFFKTHGYRAFIEEDFQTLLDGIWGGFGFLPASLAPGRTNGDREKYHAQLTMKYKDFKFDGIYIEHDYETPLSDLSTLSNKTIESREDYYLTLSYETRILEGLDLYGKVYWNKNDWSQDEQIFPPGTVWMNPTGVPAIWTDGANYTGFGTEDRRTGIEFQTTYKMGGSNTIVIGATYEHQKAEELARRANYLLTSDPFVVVELPSLQKWPDYLVMGTETRNFWALFFEDVWDIADDLRLTLGARYDHYNDFGGHFSPRAGLTWEYMKGYDIKLMYGHAFRAPDFWEFYEPLIGNPDLDPEAIDTYEISFGAEFTNNFDSRITLYHRETEDGIIQSGTTWPLTYANRGSSRDQGVELEMRYDFGRGTYLAGNYNYQNRKTGNKQEVHLGKIMANVRLSRYLNFYADCQFLDGVERYAAGDDRDDPSGFGIVNATLIAKKFLEGYEGLEFRGSVYNLLDKDARTGTVPEIPNDWPLPGRNFIIELKYKF